MPFVSSGHSSLEMTCGRPLCPRCKAPMWTVRVELVKAAESHFMFQCPHCEYSQNIAFPQKQKLAQRR